ncbi:MAG: histidinol-phosphatase HisJ family protein [Lachnospiraceae bacterium]|nr:histidinol-phosphatase HisJ family protein [Lachnospiraceae bacterium]
MAIYSDYHLHSAHSCDSRASMESMILHGIRLDLKSLCFTEHHDIGLIPFPQSPELTFQLDTPPYYEECLRLREKYAGEIEVHFGVELGILSHKGREITEYASAWPFEFIIASSHLCEGIDVYYPNYYRGKTKEEAYGIYFQSILDNLSVFHDFDVYGHLDYIIRYAPYEEKTYSYHTYGDYLDSILHHLIHAGKGIEINTGGIKKGLAQPHPCTEVIRRYRELGGEIITVGSDAHRPEDMADHFRLAEDILKECGFSYYTIFKERKPKFIRL